MIKYVFDLDGTITKHETLPIIANHFGIQSDIDQLTKDTVNGNIPFVESFIRRVHVLGELPVDEISELLSVTAFNDEVASFITSHSQQCVIATGNLDCWVDGILSRVDCVAFCSHAQVKENKVQKIQSILKKEDVVKKLKDEGNKVVYIGEGNNDAEAMRVADISVAFGLVHEPSTSVISIASYAVYSEKALCRLLNQLY